MGVGKMKQTEKAYIAGMIDRSAFLGAIKYDGNKYTVRLVMQSHNPKSFDKVKSLCGGYLIKRKKDNHVLWILQGRARVASLLSSILPYLVARKRSAEKIIEFDRSWTKVPLGNLEERAAILEKRDRMVVEILGLKPTWKRESKREPLFSWV